MWFSLMPDEPPEILFKKLMSSLLPYLPGNASKTFVIERLDTQQAIFVEAHLDLSVSPVDLSPILAHHCPLHSHRVQIYDPTINTFVTLKGEGNVSSAMLQPGFILIRYSLRPSQPARANKEERSRQRTIGEAIELVKEWRLLHETRTRPENRRKKLSLPQAASLLGVAKKSLDDYYCQLRIAEQLGFDFEAHLNDGVGVLRTFVKNQRHSVKQQKHPKILRVIQDLSFLSPAEAPKESPSAEKMEEKTEQVKGEHQYGRIQLQKHGEERRAELSDHGSARQIRGEWPSGGKKVQMIETLASEYYRGFQYLLDDPIDPFLNLSRNFSIRLSNSDDQSNSILFF